MEDAKAFVVEAARSLARRLRIEEASPGFLPVGGAFVRETTQQGAAVTPSRTLPVGTTTARPPLPWDLEALARVVAECRLCPLHATRTTTVFGEGRVGCDVMFVGEGPGAEEDATGRPFVGAAGRLLDRMIAAMGLVREDCYIANVVKCRPPFNAVPSPAEAEACRPFLDRQIALVRPRVLVALGRSAAIVLTKNQGAIARLRGTWFDYRQPDQTAPSGQRHDDIPVLVTYHPAALLRNPDLKVLAWRDLQRVMARIGKRPPSSE